MAWNSLGQLGRHHVGPREPQVDAAQVTLLAPASSSSRYIAGTPMKIRACRSSIRSSTRHGIEPPERGDRDAREGEAQTGGEAHDVGDGQGRHGRRSRQHVQAPRAGGADSARWLSRTPFGRPVVPDV